MVPFIAGTLTPYVLKGLALLVGRGDALAVGYFLAQTAPALHLVPWILALLTGALAVLRAVRLAPGVAVAASVARSLPAAVTMAAICSAGALVTADDRMLTGSQLIALIATAMAVLGVFAPTQSRG